jgi:hypothetical protein
MVHGSGARVVVLALSVLMSVSGTQAFVSSPASG